MTPQFSCFSSNAHRYGLWPMVYLTSNLRYMEDKKLKSPKRRRSISWSIGLRNEIWHRSKFNIYYPNFTVRIWVLPGKTCIEDGPWVSILLKAPSVLIRFWMDGGDLLKPVICFGWYPNKMQHWTEVGVGICGFVDFW